MTDIPTGRSSGKVIIEAEQAIVEALANQLADFFEVTHRSKFNHIARKPGQVRCYLYIVPNPKERPDG